MFKDETWRDESKGEFFRQGYHLTIKKPVVWGHVTGDKDPIKVDGATDGI